MNDELALDRLMDLVIGEKAPNTQLYPGDQVLMCPDCSSSDLFVKFTSSSYGKTTFYCSKCGNEFSLSIEYREGKLCFMWQWGSKK